MSRCKSCAAPVVWVVTTAGKRMPVDGDDLGGWTAPDTFADGNVWPTGESTPAGATVVVVSNTRPLDHGNRSGPWRSHFASCPHADAHRRRGR